MRLAVAAFEIDVVFMASSSWGLWDLEVLGNLQRTTPPRLASAAASAF